MTVLDLPIEELVSYRPERREEGDFDEFWRRTLAEAASFPLDSRFVPTTPGCGTSRSWTSTSRATRANASRAGSSCPALA